MVLVGPPLALIEKSSYENGEACESIGADCDRADWDDEQCSKLPRREPYLDSTRPSGLGLAASASRAACQAESPG